MGMRWGSRFCCLIIYVYLTILYVLPKVVPAFDTQNFVDGTDMLMLQPIELMVTFVLIIGPHLEWHYKAIALLSFVILSKFIILGGVRPDLMMNGVFQMIGQIVVAVGVSLHAMLRRDLRAKHNHLISMKEEAEKEDGVSVEESTKMLSHSLFSLPPPSLNRTSNVIARWTVTFVHLLRSGFSFLCNQHFNDPQKESEFQVYCSRMSQKEHRYMYSTAALSSLCGALMQHLRHGDQAYNIMEFAVVIPSICITGAIVKSLPAFGPLHPKREQLCSTILYLVAQIASIAIALHTAKDMIDLAAVGVLSIPARDAFICSLIATLNLIISRACIDGLRGRFAFACCLVDIVGGLMLEMWFNIIHTYFFGLTITMLGVIVGLLIQPRAEKDLRIHHEMLARYGRHLELKAEIENALSIPRLFSPLTKKSMSISRSSGLEVIECEVNRYRKGSEMK
ncbi:hypothetical protein SpCBS45565_g03294 [Spizellomyces sp. 'palustris']|nr:hypothetical protein SpCBS45565_g03294 [Spizellomyces sp. 'palustris']